MICLINCHIDDGDQQYGAIYDNLHATLDALNAHSLGDQLESLWILRIRPTRDASRKLLETIRTRIQPDYRRQIRLLVSVCPDLRELACYRVTIRPPFEQLIELDVTQALAGSRTMPS